MNIARTYDLGIATIMKSLLVEEGVEVIESFNAGHVSIAGADQSYYVDVFPDDRERACRILRDHDFGKFLI
jgi:hypothetical protein